MIKGILEMTGREASRIKIMGMVMAKKMSLKVGSAEMGVSYRQAKRMVSRVKKEGDKGIIHRQRGRPSKRQLRPEKIQEIVGLYKEKYPDFGPTFFREKLLEIHGIKISTESVRQILIGEGLHRARKSKKSGIHIWRERKEQAGEMIQIDGSHHRWLEERLDQEFCLMAYIDDATNQVYGRFYEYEGVFPVLDSFGEFVRQKGIPVSVYLDRHSTYKINRKTTIEEDLEGDGATTQFQRVMKEVGVRVIYARSPQAKGRVERLFETLQDRLVKELRLANVTTIAGANLFLEGYWGKHNEKFCVSPKQESALFKAVSKEFDYQWTFSVQAIRAIARDYTIRFCNRIFLVRNPTLSLRNQRVVVRQALNGELQFETKYRILSVKEVTQATLDSQERAQKERESYLKKQHSIASKSKKSWMDNFHFGKASFVPQRQSNSTVSV